ncbi:hypothetical protein [Legionella sainthelensi]|uniref:Uncharacterized protein n=1 Tax=Legionella sainthelensi TaxID=28087 RepID=A0A2H5FNJ4_9GAMM|nr:hypothetical protein [Legionella sainthelensi]AUH73147.1 hypothetical protein CAB17_14625 [Legionella sainthelensi]
MLRYQKTLGSTWHARDFERQELKIMIGCGVINKLISLGMPASYRSTYILKIVAMQELKKQNQLRLR